MRQITAKYDSECRRCAGEIERGQHVVHEKRVGVFCIECAPAEGSEELRSYRQQALDRRADRLNERADKRRRAAYTLRKRDEPLFQCHAFRTQPGRIPERERALKRREKAHQLDAEAEQLERKAAQPAARVKGDAAARDERRREAVREWIQPGMRVRHALVGLCTVVKVNRKTARLRFDCSGAERAEDLIFIGRAED